MKFNIQELYTQNSQIISVLVKLHKTNKTGPTCTSSSYQFTDMNSVSHKNCRKKAQSHLN